LEGADVTRYVTRYTVTGVRREQSADGSHTHISGVFAGGNYFPRQQVIRSINLLNDWVARAAGNETPIVVVDSCPYFDCAVSPYLQTPDNAEHVDAMKLLPEVLSESEAS
jgi:hypothetical protein